MKKFVVLGLLSFVALSNAAFAQEREDVPIYDVWKGIGNPPFMYSENVIRHRQEPMMKGFVQNYEDAYIAPSLRTRDLPNPFNTSLRTELGYFETTQNLGTVTITK
jgi:hypothetical protein